MKKKIFTLLICLISVQAFAQVGLTGTVVGLPTKEPVVGATVIIKGTTNGAVTGVEGEFSLNVKAGDVLVVNYLGYDTQEVPVAATMSHVIVELKENALAVDEVVVVGYGTQKKVNLTGAIAAVDTEKLENLATSKLSTTLAGRAPGVQVINNSGFAGSSASISIRGSFGEPLYVINGIIRNKLAFDNLDPNEVASISFLKDAASAAIYGSKAGNGVVLVTTKKGSKGKANFQYKGSYSFSNTTQPMQDWTAHEELNFLNKVATHNNNILATPDPNFRVPNGPEIFEYFNDKTYSVNDYVWQNPWNTQHNISVDGGSDKITYFMMAGYNKEQGSYKNVDYERFNLRSDITAQITDSFKINLNIGGNQNNADRFYWPYDGAEDNVLGDFYRTTYNWSRLYPFYTDKQGNPMTSVTEYPVYVGGWNPVEMVVGDRYRKVRNRDFEGIIRADLDLGKVLKGLSTAFSAQYNAADKNSKAFITHNTAYIFQQGDANNKYVPGAPDPNKMATHNLSSSYEGINEIVELTNSYQINWFLNYNRTFGKHNVSAMVVYEQSQSNAKYLNGTAENLIAPIDQIFAASSDTKYRNFSGSEGERSRVSWLGRFNYNFDDRYIAEFSFREDGNDKFGPGKRWGFFPSASVAWRISEEAFFDVDWFNNLKLRGSYGTTGDDGGDDVGTFGWRNKYGNSGGYIFGDTYSPGVTIGSVPNPFITWASLEMYDVGIDFGFLKNRLTGEAGFFYKKKSDILQTRVASLPDTYGRGKAPENYAEQSWKGFELALRWANTHGDFSYSVNANIGYTVDKWLTFDEPVNQAAWKTRVGYPDKFQAGYIADGIYNTQAELDALPEGFTQFGTVPRLGMVKYVDIRKANEEAGQDGKIDSNDWDYLSRRTTPRINYGFGGSFSWKGITLDAHFQGVGGYDKFIRNGNTGGIFQVNDRPYFDLWANGDTWSVDNQDAKYPAATGEWNDNYGAAHSTFWKRNGAYLRLKLLSLSYDLPSKWFKQLGVSGVQVYANGSNLFCISGFDFYDVEQERIDTYPLMRTYTFGLSLNF